ncbi:MAG TPA: SRPBCC family protein [Gemmatimonadota bacterium]|nr:SRPBCC family protein [Gemmatimonadota bacterium]
MDTSFTPDPRLDLVLERVVDVPPGKVWAAWTRPEHVVKWFTPLPWSTVDCEIDLRPGGIFRTVMRSPEGEEHNNVACFLEVVENERLVWTDALGAGWRPNPEPFMTAVVAMEPHGNGTKYTAIAIHKDEETRAKHEEMGFHDGWAKALDQLVEHAKTM